MPSKSRPRRPYENKKISRKSALIFGLGLGALLLTTGLLIGLAIPNLGTRLDNLSYRARTYYRKLIPHPEYLPTPAPRSANSATQPLPETNLAPVTPTSIPSPTPAHTAAPTPTTPAPAASRAPHHAVDDLTDGDNLLLPSSSEEASTLADTDERVQPQSEDRSTTNVPLVPTRDNVQLTGFNHQWQTWNNCGPATITTYMSYFDYTETQADAAQFLKPNRDDKNVSPHELVAYARQSGMGAMMRQGGSLDQLKRFLSNGFPVLLETWLVHDGDGLGHYRLITGFDDSSGQFRTTDSLNGPEYAVSYEQLDADWRVFNRLYVVIYPPDQEQTVSAIIGDDMDDSIMYQRLLTEAQADIEADPTDAVAYFNQGEALTRLGRPEEAVVAFDQARRLGLHWRRLWYQFTPFEAYYAVGRYQDVLDLAAATLKGTGGLEEAYYYHGLALHATGQLGAAEDFEAALAYNPNFAPAAEALRVLE